MSNIKYFKNDNEYNEWYKKSKVLILNIEKVEVGILVKYISTKFIEIHKRSRRWT